MESFQWLVKEVQQQKGECLLMKVESFEGLSDRELIDLFIEKSEKEYKELEETLIELEKCGVKKSDSDESNKVHVEIEKLRKRHSEIARCDFFDAPGGPRILARVAKLERSLTKQEDVEVHIPKSSIKKFQKRVWVTRPRPHVDRVACIWLIKRFIDSGATFRYSLTPTEDEVSFDMKEGSTFGHVGNLCSFETIMKSFDLNEPGLATVAEIVHEIDIRDGKYLHPEIAGVDAILKGWQLKELSDSALEAHGVALFEGLHADIVRRERGNKKQAKSK